MNEEDFQIKRIAIGVIAFLLCALVAWLICVWISKFYNSAHPFLAGITFVILTLILYFYLKTNKAMGNISSIFGLQKGGKKKPQIGNPLNGGTLLEPSMETEEPTKDVLMGEIEQLKKKIQALEEEIKTQYISITDVKNDYIPLLDHQKKLASVKKENAHLIAEKEEIYLPALELKDTLLDMAVQMQYAYSKLKDDEIDKKNLINYIIDSYCRFEHYDENIKDSFKAEGSRPRENSDSPDQQIIETCPALFIDKTNECISKGKYVIITDKY